MSDRFARAYAKGEGKPVVQMGGMVVEDPKTGIRTMRLITRGLGASDEEYPHDAGSGA